MIFGRFVVFNIQKHILHCKNLLYNIFLAETCIVLVCNPNVASDYRQKIYYLIKSFVHAEELLRTAYNHPLSVLNRKRNLESVKAIMILIYPSPLGSYRKMKFGIWESYSVMHIPILSDPIEGTFSVWNIDRN